MKQKRIRFACFDKIFFESSSEVEFKEFKLRCWTTKNWFQLSASSNLETQNTFSSRTMCLNRVSYLSPCLNSFNSTSAWRNNYKYFVSNWHFKKTQMKIFFWMKMMIVSQMMTMFLILMILFLTIESNKKLF